MKIITCLILGLIVLESVSCSKKIDCPDFDKSLYEWLPYAKNDTIILEKETKDTSIALYTESTLLWHTTYYMTNLDCGNCWDEILIGNYNSRITNLYISVRLEKNQINSEEYYIKGCNFNYYRSNYHKENNFTFAGTVYTEVKIFENVLSEKLFSQLIVAKFYGIVGLVDKNGIKWIRQKGYSLKPVNMEIYTKACG